jgi:hypothetical protein
MGKLTEANPLHFVALKRAGVAAETGALALIPSTVPTLAVVPAIYALVKRWRLNRGFER